MKAYFLFVIGIFLTFGLAHLAGGTSIFISFDPEEHKTYSSPIIYSDDISLEISTTEDALCRYSSNNETFDSMFGSFDDNYETIHKKVFSDLSDGVHRYYVACRDIHDLGNTSKGLGKLEVVLKVSKPIYADISLSEDDPLTKGIYDVGIVTSKIPLNTPELSYSYDGVDYTSLVLSGSGTSWKASLIIDEEREAVGGFKFYGVDIAGRSGDEVFGDTTFLVDTVKPRTISMISAIGRAHEIELEWYYDNEDHSEILLYRSSEPGVDHTDVFKEVDADDDSYVDESVSSGKTYYYKIAARDAAGNLADLSKEVSATVLLKGETSVLSSSGGLSQELHGLVDALLVEVDDVSSRVKDRERIFKDLEGVEQTLFEGLRINSEVDNAVSEISRIRLEVERYKSQDFSREILESRLDSSRIKLRALEKNTPESISVIRSEELVQEIEEDSIRKLALEVDPSLENSHISKSVEQTLTLAREKNLEISGVFSFAEVSYLDGSTKEYSFFKHELASQFELTQNGNFYLRVPPEIFGEKELIVTNIDYNKESDSLFSFPTDNKQIVYFLEKEVSLSVAEDIVVLPVVFSTPEISSITGYSILDLTTSDYFGFIVLGFFAAGLALYLLALKISGSRNAHKTSQELESFISKLRDVKRLKQEGKSTEAQSLYDSLKIEYVHMSDSEKQKIVQEVAQISRPS